MKRRSFTVSKSTHYTSAQCPYNNHPITTCLLHPFLGDLRFYRAVNTINLLNLHPDEEAMRRRLMTSRTSVKRVGRVFTSSQSRYLKTRLHPLLGDLRFHNRYLPLNLLNLHSDEEAMHRRFMTRRTPGSRY